MKSRVLAWVAVEISNQKVLVRATRGVSKEKIVT
jgi:hypothetical protein